MRGLLLAIALALSVPSVALAGKKTAASKPARKAKKAQPKKAKKAKKAKKSTRKKAAKKKAARKKKKKRFRMRKYRMTLVHANTKEKLTNLWVIRHDPKNPNRQWVGKRARKRLTHFFRDWRTGRTKYVPEKLIWLLYLVQQRFDAPIEIVSGYRHKERKSSRHKMGRAVDFRVQGVDPKEVWAYCKRFDNVGLGWYPNSRFVHMDVRKKSRYWVDDAGPGEDADYREGVAQRRATKKRKKRSHRKRGPKKRRHTAAH